MRLDGVHIRTEHVQAGNTVAWAGVSPTYGMVVTGHFASHRQERASRVLSALSSQVDFAPTSRYRPYDAMINDAIVLGSPRTFTTNITQVPTARYLLSSTRPIW